MYKPSVQLSVCNKKTETVYTIVLALTARPVGVDMFKLISMIVKGVETVRRNHEECKQLSHYASATENLLHELANLKVVEHPKMWKPIHGLRGTLCKETGTLH